MNMKKQDILKDRSYQKYVKKKNITQRTLDTYVFSLLQFCNANKRTFDEMINEVLEEQYPFIDEHGRIHEYNPEYSKIDNYLNNTAKYLKMKGNSNNSIHGHLIRIRAVLSGLNVKLPKPIELEKDNKDWYVLSKDDIRYINSISPLHHQAIITFMAHTGIRTGDVLNFRISDFMKATYSNHECSELDDFLEKAPWDMIGYWEFIPKKTRKHNVECKVYNTAESSNLILKSLHRRQASIEKINQKKGTNLKLEKHDALFSSRNQNFKTKMSENTLTTLCHRRNKELQKHNARILQQQLDNNDIGIETFNEKLEEIPVFHAHGLREFFITTLARKRVDLRASALMEGHSPIMKNDKSYVDNDELEDLIWEEYNRVIPALSFLKDEEDYELSQQNRDLLLENTRLKQENQNIKDDFRKEAKKLLDELLRENNITL